MDSLLARLFEHFAHVLWRAVSILRFRSGVEDIPQPYAMCAIWLLGTILPFAFLTILGEATVPLGATAIVSMVPTMELLRKTFVVGRVAVLSTD
jgi:hypothetical protein